MNHLIFASSLAICSSASLFLLYRFSGFANLAHGEFLLLGAYVGTFAVSRGCGFAMAGLLSAVTVGMLSLGMLLVCGPLLKARNQVATLLMSIATSIAISEMLRLLAGSSGTSMPIGEGLRAPLWGLSRYEWLVVACAGVVGVGVMVFARSNFGLRARATASDAQFVECFGGSVGRLRGGTFLLAGMCAGGIGCLLAPMMAIVPYGGQEFTLKGFLVACFASSARVQAWIAACAGLAITEFVFARYLGGTTARLALWIVVIVAAFFQQWFRPASAQ